MTRWTRLLLVIAAVMGLVTLVSTQRASGAAATVSATGTVSCGRVHGLISFTPPVTLIGGTVDAAVDVVFHNCNGGSGSNVTTTDFRGKAKGSFTVTGGTGCANLVGVNPAFTVTGTLNVVWTGKVKRGHGHRPYRLLPSSMSLQMTSVAKGSNGDIGFTFSQQPVSGSFASTSSTVSGQFDSSKLWSRIVCGGSHKVKKLHLVAGTIGQP